MMGTVARTAVVAGTAQAAAGRVHRSQQQKWSQQEAAAQAQAAALPPPPPPPAPAAPAAGMEDKLSLLQQIGTLRDQGILTEAEFEAKKSQIMAS